MKILLDTHILVWAGTEKLPPKVAQYYEDKRNILYFSPINIYEIVIKFLKHPSYFGVEPVSFRSKLLDVGYKELPLNSDHSLTVKGMPLLHQDPFDRILLAQAQYEGMQFLTADKTLAKYAGPIIYVG